MRRRKRTRTEPITRKSLADKTIDDARTLVVIAFHEREMGLPGSEATAGEGTPTTLPYRGKPVNCWRTTGKGNAWRRRGGKESDSAGLSFDEAASAWLYNKFYPITMYPNKCLFSC